MINIIALALALGFAIYNYINCNIEACVFDFVLALINLPFVIYWLSRWTT